MRRTREFQRDRDVSNPALSASTSAVAQAADTTAEDLADCEDAPWRSKADVLAALNDATGLASAELDITPSMEM